MSKRVIYAKSGKIFFSKKARRILVKLSVCSDCTRKTYCHKCDVAKRTTGADCIIVYLESGPVSVDSIIGIDDALISLCVFNRQKYIHFTGPADKYMFTPKQLQRAFARGE